MTPEAANTGKPGATAADHRRTSRRQSLPARQRWVRSRWADWNRVPTPRALPRVRCRGMPGAGGRLLRPSGAWNACEVARAAQRGASTTRTGRNRVPHLARAAASGSRACTAERQLKDLRSHLDPRMSWGDLVALLVREAVARHDPRGGGRRRGRAGRKAASPRRGRSRTPAVPAPAARAGRGGDTPAPQGETAAAREQPRAVVSANAAPVRGSAPTAPATGATPAGGVAPGTRAGAVASASPATAAGPAVVSPPARSVPEHASATPAAAAMPEGQSAGARVTCPAARATAPGARRLTAPVALPGARRTGPFGRSGRGCGADVRQRRHSRRLRCRADPDAHSSGAEVRWRRRSGWHSRRAGPAEHADGVATRQRRHSRRR